MNTTNVILCVVAAAVIVIAVVAVSFWNKRYQEDKAKEDLVKAIDFYKKQEQSQKEKDRQESISWWNNYSKTQFQT